MLFISSLQTSNTSGAMKTLVLLLSLALLPALTVVASSASDWDPSGDMPAKYAKLTLSAFCLEEEAYIDDIPFNTKKIYERACCYYKNYGRYLADYTLHEEEYIDDIPFSTKDIASTTLYGEFLKKPTRNVFRLTEEPYIDDIPFDTKRIFADSIENRKQEENEYTITSFNLKDEEYIDDIPWDTREVFAEVVRYPEYARKCNMEGSVMVTFHYNEDGYIVVDMAQSPCDFLKDYVIETIENVRLTKGIISIGKEYAARFDFKLK